MEYRRDRLMKRVPRTGDCSRTYTHSNHRVAFDRDDDGRDNKAIPTPPICRSSMPIRSTAKWWIPPPQIQIGHCADRNCAEEGLALSLDDHAKSSGLINHAILLRHPWWYSWDLAE